MKAYEIKQFSPPWHHDPATPRQLKVLKFFGIPVDPPPTKGAASALIARIFSDESNRCLWAAYVYTTGDQDSSSANLLPCDRAALANVVIPDDWKPKTERQAGSSRLGPLAELIGNLLREGSPYDDPLPLIHLKGTVFCFTGKFNFGTRSRCREAVVAGGGSCNEDVTSSTDVLVIGAEASGAWSHANYGNKIEAAMVLRMQHGKPAIIPESYWTELLRAEEG